jgi:hypothetical protein
MIIMMLDILGLVKLELLLAKESGNTRMKVIIDIHVMV